MNHGSDVPAYGLWGLVAVESLFFIFFAFSFVKPKTTRDWRTFGSFSAFIVALFAEMYGFPLTIYLISGWLTRKFPGANLMSHDMGHLWYELLGFKGDPHSNPIHVLSNVLIAGGFFLLSVSWSALYPTVHSDTHSGDLAEIDLAKAFTLDADGKSLKPVETKPLGGHHSDGFVAFDVGSAPKTFSLTISGVRSSRDVKLVWPKE